MGGLSFVSVSVSVSVLVSVFVSSLSVLSGKSVLW